MKLAHFALVAALLAPCALAEPIRIDGGLTWNGWTTPGRSDQLGVFSSGTTTDVYEGFSTVFRFNNNSVSGSATGGGPTGGATGFGTGAFSTGAFANGNLILGIGVRRISGSAVSGFLPTVRFDLDNDGYRAATSVGGADGRTSFTQWSEFRDFAWHSRGSSRAPKGGGAARLPCRLTARATEAHTISSGLWGASDPGVSYDFPFRAFAQVDSYQMFLDANAMNAIYGTGNPNPFGLNPNFTGIGNLTAGSTVGISLNGLGGNNVAFGLAPNPIPEPGTGALGAVGMLVGVAGLLRRRLRRG